jgi:hypothetical protein
MPGLDRDKRAAFEQTANSTDSVTVSWRLMRAKKIRGKASDWQEVWYDGTS